MAHTTVLSENEYRFVDEHDGVTTYEDLNSANHVRFVDIYDAAKEHEEEEA